jgi:hypothetical protein
MNEFDERMAAVERLTPKTGFNVVGVDSFEDEPAYELFLVGHCATRAEAEDLLAATLKRTREHGSDEAFYIYGPDSN